MPASITFGNISLKPTDNFRYYHGPAELKRALKRSQASCRKVDTSPDITWTDIDDILGPAESNLVLKSAGGSSKGGSQNAPIIINDSGPATDTEDELPTIEELIWGNQAPSQQEQGVGAVPAAEGLIGDTSTLAAGGHQDGGSGGDADGGDTRRCSLSSKGDTSAGERYETVVSRVGEGEEDGGAAIDLVPFSAALTPTALESAAPSDYDGATGTHLRSPEQRKRARSLSSDATVSIRTILGTPDPHPDEPLSGERPRLAKRQKSYLLPADESASKRTPTPMAGPSRASTVEIGHSPGGMGSEAVSGESDASDNGEMAKAADREGHDDSSDSAADNEPLEPVKPVEPGESAIQQPSTLRQSPSYRYEVQDLHELGELRDAAAGGGRNITVEGDHRPWSPVRATRRQRRAKAPRRLPAASYAQPRSVNLADQRTPDPESHSSPSEPAVHPLHHPACSAYGKAAAGPDCNHRTGSVQDHLYKVNEITLLPISAGVLFLASTVQTTGDMLQLSCSGPAELVERLLGYAGRVQGVALKPLAPTGFWLVSGFLHLGKDCGDVPAPRTGLEPTPAAGVYDRDLRKRAGALCGGAAGGEEDGRVSGDSHRRVKNNGRCVGDDDSDDDVDGDDRSTVRTKRPWDPLDDQRLLAWRAEKKSWKWIFKQLPGRTEGAVRVRWHTLRNRPHKKQIGVAVGDLN